MKKTSILIGIILSSFTIYCQESNLNNQNSPIISINKINLSEKSVEFKEKFIQLEPSNSLHFKVTPEEKAIRREEERESVINSHPTHN